MPFMSSQVGLSSKSIIFRQLERMVQLKIMNLAAPYSHGWLNPVKSSVNKARVNHLIPFVVQLPFFLILAKSLPANSERHGLAERN